MKCGDISDSVPYDKLQICMYLSECKKHTHKHIQTKRECRRVNALLKAVTLDEPVSTFSRRSQLSTRDAGMSTRDARSCL